MAAMQLSITGKVQGVFFRSTAKEVADRLLITGWVRNEPDGSVLVHAEGTDEALQEFEAWCREGPPSARVDGVKKRISTEQGSATFAIA